ncbi:hypothetical protein ACWEAF_37310 [Streptomyces sp. NPDC005071]
MEHDIYQFFAAWTLLIISAVVMTIFGHGAVTSAAAMVVVPFTPLLIVGQHSSNRLPKFCFPVVIGVLCAATLVVYLFAHRPVWEVATFNTAISMMALPALLKGASNSTV